MKKFKGIIPALVTPYTKEGNINETSLRKVIRMNLEKQCTGFYVGGSTAEAFVLSMNERKKLIDIVVDEVNGEGTVIYHVGNIGTAESIELAVYGEKAGADAISAIPPFYYKFSFEEIKKHYKDIVEKVDIPMIVYNFPVLSGVQFSLENLEDILSDDRIIGVKHTSLNVFDVERLKCRNDKHVLSGHDEVFLASLTMGADGAIGSTFNLMAEKFVKIYQLFHENNMKDALRIQREANNVIEALIKVGVNQGIKYGLEKKGIECNGCRSPFKHLRDDAKTYLDKIFEENNV